MQRILLILVLDILCAQSHIQWRGMYDYELYDYRTNQVSDVGSVHKGPGPRDFYNTSIDHQHVLQFHDHCCARLHNLQRIPSPSVVGWSRHASSRKRHHRAKRRKG